MGVVSVYTSLLSHLRRNTMAPKKDGDKGPDESQQSGERPPLLLEERVDALEKFVFAMIEKNCLLKPE